MALRGRELHEIPATELAKYVVQVIDEESPVHTMEVARRITEGAGLKRAGGRIQEAVDKAIDADIMSNGTRKRGEFLWRRDMTKPVIRDRSALDSNEKKFELIAPEEIDEAIVGAVAQRFSVTKDGMVVDSDLIKWFAIAPGAFQCVT